MNNDFWHTLEQLISESRLVIDRPKGSRHPRSPEIIYPLDYGYIEGTTSADGDGIDIWIGSQTARELTGVACTYDTRKKDAEIKLLVGCSADDIQTILRFHTNGMKIIFIPRPHAGVDR